MGALAGPAAVTAARPVSAGRALLAVVLCGMLLRLQIVAVGPLIPDIQAELGGTFVQLGLLTTVPVMAMALVAVLAARVASATGTFLGITVSLVALSAAGLLRTSADNVTDLILATIPMGAGMGIAGALAPAVIKETQSHRPARAAGAHVAGMIAGSGISTALVIPLAQLFGTWRAALVVLALGSVVGTVAWVVVTRGARGTRPSSAGRAEVRWRHAGTWVIVAIFAFQAVIFWGLGSWLATAYQRIGWSPEAAGGLTSLLNASPLIGAVWISSFGDRFGTRRQNLTAASALVVVGAVVLAAALPVVTPVGAVLAGAGLGALFALVIALPLDVSRSIREAAGLTSLTFAIGFGSAAVTPMVLGALADATGSFALPLWSMVLVAVVMLVTCQSTSYLRMRFLDDRAGPTLPVASDAGGGRGHGRACGAPSAED